MEWKVQIDEGSSSFFFFVSDTNILGSIEHIDSFDVFKTETKKGVREWRKIKISCQNNTKNNDRMLLFFSREDVLNEMVY